MRQAVTFLRAAATLQGDMGGYRVRLGRVEGEVAARTLALSGVPQLVLFVNNSLRPILFSGEVSVDAFNLFVKSRCGWIAPVPGAREPPPWLFLPAQAPGSPRDTGRSTGSGSGADSQFSQLTKVDEEILALKRQLTELEEVERSA